MVWADSSLLARREMFSNLCSLLSYKIFPGEAYTLQSEEFFKGDGHRTGPHLTYTPGSVLLHKADPLALHNGPTSLTLWAYKLYTGGPTSATHYKGPLTLLWAH